MFFRKNDCKHKWEKISEVVTKSPFETALEAIQQSGIGQNLNVPHQMCHTDRKHILVVTCTLCGKIEKFITDIK